MKEILTISIPALLVLLTVYILIDKFLRDAEKIRKIELQKINLPALTPIRLRAYERLILVLERTAPNALIVSVIKPEMTCSELHQLLVENIRKEFAHNVSQQIYVSDELWSAIKLAQETLVQLVNTCAAKLKAECKASELAELIIQIYSATDETPTEIAMGLLKNEVRTFTEFR